MATDLAKMYISRIISMKIMDRNTGEVLDEWDSEKCKNLNIEADVALNFSDFEERADINEAN